MACQRRGTLVWMFSTIVATGAHHFELAVMTTSELFSAFHGLRPTDPHSRPHLHALWPALRARDDKMDRFLGEPYHAHLGHDREVTDDLWSKS